jgi:beta-galactosidase
LASFEYMDSKVQKKVVEFARDGGIVILGPKIPTLNAHFQKEDMLKKYLSSEKMVKVTFDGKTAGFKYEVGGGSIIQFLELDKKKIGKVLDLALKNVSVLKLEKNNPKVDFALHRDVRDPKHVLVFAANPTSETIEAEARLDITPGYVEEIWKKRRVEIKNKQLVDILPPYTVMIYEGVSG